MDSAESGIGIVGIIIYLAIIVVGIVSMWKLYEKAGKPGWAAIVPIYNLVVLLEIINKPIWWIVLFFIPIVNIVAIFLIYIELAKVFGKDTLYGILMVFFGIIMIPMLAFGDAQYQGAGGKVYDDGILDRG